MRTIDEVSRLELINISVIEGIYYRVNMVLNYESSTGEAGCPPPDFRRP